MNIFNKKILLVILTAFFIIIGSIFFIVDNRKNSELSFETENNNIDVTANLNDNLTLKKEDEIQDSTIFVHIIGEVKNSGIIKLQERSKNY